MWANEVLREIKKMAKEVRFKFEKLLKLWQIDEAKNYLATKKKILAYKV